MALLEHHTDEGLLEFFQDYHHWLDQLRKGKRPQEQEQLKHEELIQQSFETIEKRLFSMHDDFSQVMIEFLSMGEKIPRIAAKLREFIRERRRLMGLFFGIINPGFPTLLMAAMMGLLFHYRLDLEIIFEEGRDMLRNYLSQISKRS